METVCYLLSPGGGTETGKINIIFRIVFHEYLQGDPKTLWCGLEEKKEILKYFVVGVFHYIYSHNLKKLEFLKLFRKKVMGF